MIKLANDNEKELGRCDTESLLKFMWFQNTAHFGMRGVTEHHNPQLGRSWTVTVENTWNSIKESKTEIRWYQAYKTAHIYKNDTNADKGLHLLFTFRPFFTLQLEPQPTLIKLMKNSLFDNAMAKVNFKIC